MPEDPLNFDPSFNQFPTEFTSGQKKAAYSGPVVISIYQRNARKRITAIANLRPDLNFEKVLKAMRKEFNCSGTLVNDVDLGIVIQLTGDHRKIAKEWLIEREMASPEMILLKGA